jgi:catechol-2,3-dioxygenase
MRRDPGHPAIFVSDGTIMVTLWQTKSDLPGALDKNHNVGLHHVAFQVDREADLDTLHQRLTDYGIQVEFAPEPLRQGPAKHTMCYEPSGIRVEFIWPAAR